MYALWDNILSSNGQKRRPVNLAMSPPKAYIAQKTVPAVPSEVCVIKANARLER